MTASCRFQLTAVARPCGWLRTHPIRPTFGRDSILVCWRELTRIAELFRHQQGRAIPRSAIAAIAAQLDPLKRVRANGGARDILREEGVVILWGQNDRALIAELGLKPLLSDEFVSFSPQTEPEVEMLKRAGHL